MWNWLGFSTVVWRLEGFDTFAGHSYPIAGRYRSKEQALKAARRELKRIERLQPSKASGGQDGIQDQVYVVDPEGQRMRVLPQ